jgi:hypothetical protein
VCSWSSKQSGRLAFHRGASISGSRINERIFSRFSSKCVYAPESLDHQRNRIMKLQIEIDKYEAASKHLLEKRENIRSLMREPLIEAPR